MIEYYKTQNLIEKLVTNRVVPGVNYAFIKQNQVFTSTVGFSTYIPENIQLNPFGQYDLASLTKVLGTTNVFLKLQQEDQLDFKTPVHAFLPEFKDERVSLSHLLTHSSGVMGYIPNRDQLYAKELREAILNLPVTAEFEKNVRYSDTNFLILGFVLEAIFQKPVWDVIDTEVINHHHLPLTTFSPNHDLAIPTTLQPDGNLLQGVVHDPKARVLKSHAGNAGLFSDLNDLVRISQNYLGLRDDILPLSDTTISALFENKVGPNLTPRSWGWDLRFDPLDGHSLIYHTGFTGTFMILDRQLQSGMIVLTNRIHPSGHNQIFLAARDQIVRQFLLENKKD